MFTGLSAFPLTPLTNDAVDESSFAGLVERLAAVGVDSITTLGSTGSYAYLSAQERARVARVAVEHAADTPVVVGIGALRTSQVLANLRSAQDAGAAGVLLAPMTYQPLSAAEVLDLFTAVAEHAEVPVIVYDNPTTTRFTFTTDLYGRIAALPGIASIKIPAVPADPCQARARVDAIRAVIPDHVTIGVSGDAYAAAGLTAGADAWYSVLGGTLPEPALKITRAAQTGDPTGASTQSKRLAPLWSLFDEFGSLRVVAAIAEHLDLAPHGCLPLPVHGLRQHHRDRVAAVLHELELTP
ncbi:dihydrodipicolinate synthase family protein [Cumulibacter manganitolerans]|uniref:dihydrodipicolinate synthase family protein n=1 Tax=Cumulibacter manganitolerans TaxID=1884992 RepID=UPI0012980A3E|nr:dihydrodipicolinate synthase family protein [Cumulibacter manganitolerans]